MARTLHERVKQKSFENPRQEAMITLLVTSGHYRQMLNDVCQKYGITHDQYNVLRILKGVHPEGHPRREIIDRMIERTPDVTRLLDRLVKRGLVKRTKSEEDRRLSIAVITQKGQDLLEEMDPEFSQVSKSFTQNVSEQELKAFSQICNQFLANLDE
ncbi:MAG: MarR family winged helix-turn-helix transcriptional regulator [Bacteroidota bacterium]